jgi:Reverse transcriptase (RNA-dependent DNA polymerase)
MGIQPSDKLERGQDPGTTHQAFHHQEMLEAEVGYMKNKRSFSQQWAQREGKGQSKVVVPDRFQKYTKVFSEEEAKHFPPSRPEDLIIMLLPDALKTINCKKYKLTAEETKSIRTFLMKQQAKGYITRSKSAWSSPFFYIKKQDRKLRPVYNYRKVNEWTVKDVYPLPRINTIFNQMGDTKLMSKFDIRDGYYNICIHPDSQWITVVKMDKGLFEAKVMPFGLCNAPAAFQRMADCIFADLKKKYPCWVHWYLDDFLIVTPDDLALHDQIMKEYLEILKRELLFLKLEKCQFAKREIEFLGYVIDQGTIHIDPSKKHGLEDWPHNLKLVREVRSTLGVLGYQQQFIPGFADIARPLTNLLKKMTKFEWTKECTEAVDQLIKAVTCDPILQRPNLTKLFVLEVNTL